MYKQYLNDYERRAEQIRKAARAVENGGDTIDSPSIPVPSAILKEEKTPKTHISQIKKQDIGGLGRIFERFAADDILILALLFLLITNEDKDMTLIIILGYLFLSGL